MAAVPRNEGDPAPGEASDGDLVAGLAVRRVDVHELRFLEQAVETRPSDDTDLSFRVHLSMFLPECDNRVTAAPESDIG